MTTGCYLLHFEPSYKHAAHYLGWSPEVQARVNAHLHGKGARLTEVAHAAGIKMMLVRVWEGGDRKEERRLKRWNNSKRLCPICLGEPVQLPLLEWMPAIVAENDAADTDDDSNHTHQPPQGPPLIDFDAELDEYLDDISDREAWSRGHW